MTTPLARDEPQVLATASLGAAWLAIARKILAEGIGSRYDDQPVRELSLVTLAVSRPDPDDEIIARYAGRWAIEVAIGDAKNITGAGEARNRRPRAVERTVPFALFTQSIVIIWYHLAGHSPAIARDRRGRAPWYAAKTCPAYIDMITRLRRVLIAAQFHPGAPRQPTPEEIHAVRLA